MIEWIESRSKILIPKKNGQLLCSSIDPVSEGKKWAQKAVGDLEGFDVAFVLGLAGGFHISQLASLVPNKEIIVIESDVELESQLLSRRGRMPPNVTLVTGSVPEELVHSVYVRSGIKSIFRVLHYPTSCRLDPDYFSKVDEILMARSKASLSVHLSGRPALRKFFSSLDLDQVEQSAPITILEIERSIRKSKAPVSREGMIFLTLRELVK